MYIIYKPYYNLYNENINAVNKNNDYYAYVLPFYNIHVILKQLYRNVYSVRYFNVFILNALHLKNNLHTN